MPKRDKQKEKYLLAKRQLITYTSTMCLLVFVAILGFYRFQKDYNTVKDDNLDKYTVRVATDGGVSTEVTPTQTVTTSAITVTPTQDPETEVMISLDYINETMTITKGPKNSTSFYISQDKQKTWEVIENTNGKLDLSIFMKTSDNFIYLKGDKDKKVVEVKIPKEDNGLKVNYVVEAGVGKLSFTNAVGSLEYRKGVNSAWKVYSGTIDLKDYEVNGYSLQFRTMALTTTRAGKIVSVKIPKRPTPPSISTDYSKFTISGMKSGVTQYRIAGSSNWITYETADSKIKTLDLSTLLLPKGSSLNTLPIPVATLEFRNMGADKKVASGIRIVEIAAQPTAPVAANVKLNTNKITFVDASSDKPYEFFVLHNKEVVNLLTAKWKKVTNPKEIVITKVGTASIVPGDVIYYRLASTKDKKTKQITPASMYASVVITSIVVPQ